VHKNNCICTFFRVQLETETVNVTQFLALKNLPIVADRAFLKGVWHEIFDFSELVSRHRRLESLANISLPAPENEKLAKIQSLGVKCTQLSS
jgi:hypothetical protein